MGLADDGRAPCGESGSRSGLMRVSWASGGDERLGAPNCDHARGANSSFSDIWPHIRKIAGRVCLRSFVNTTASAMYPVGGHKISIALYNNSVSTAQFSEGA